MCASLSTHQAMLNHRPGA